MIAEWSWDTQEHSQGALSMVLWKTSWCSGLARELSLELKGLGTWIWGGLSAPFSYEMWMMRQWGHERALCRAGNYSRSLNREGRAVLGRAQHPALCVCTLKEERNQGCFPMVMPGGLGGLVLGLGKMNASWTLQGLGLQHMCPQQPPPAREVLFLELDSAARGLFDSPEIHALFALFFGQLCWQLFFPPRGRGTGDIWLTKFPVCPCVPGTCLPKDSPGVRASGALALFFGDAWLWFQLKFLPSSSSSSSGCQAQQDWPGLGALDRYLWAIKIYTKLWVLLPLLLSAVKCVDICVHQWAMSVFPCHGGVEPAGVGTQFPWVWPWSVSIQEEVGSHTVDTPCFFPASSSPIF